jgi:threonine aldolase
MKTIDLRSDTVTRPTPAMRAAMAEAPLGDDVFGDDPSVNALLCAMLGHCERGDEALVGQMAHTYRYEAGGAAVFGSVQPQPLPQQPDGTLRLADIEAAIKPDDEHFAKTRLLCLENTWNGQVLAQSYVDAAIELARRRGLATHLDGARLWNAAVASGVAPAQIARGFDSVSVCFSKGLGAPVGSALVGPADFIARARRIRKALGGGMRQVGLLAAAASHALDHHVARLAEDHANAARLAAGLGRVAGITVRASPTNIVFADVAGGRAVALLAHLEKRGVLATGLIGLRFVTHLDVDAEGVDRAIAGVAEFMSA